MNEMAPDSYIDCIRVNYSDPEQMHDLTVLLDAYSMDPMGNKEPLSDEVNAKLKARLARVHGAFSFIAYLKSGSNNAGVQKSEPVGLVNCFPGFSTFKGEPLVNIHDIVVVKEHRGKGIAKLLITAVEKEASDRGCCKITLEVRTDNPAENLYRKLGFTDGNQTMLFLSKPLGD